MTRYKGAKNRELGLGPPCNCKGVGRVALFFFLYIYTGIIKLIDPIYSIISSSTDMFHSTLFKIRNGEEL